ncbi:MAG: Gfo/Idh/MocA family oxidoreductase [Polyangiales bacterium]
MNTPLRVGIVGLNNQGRDHVEASLHARGVTLTAICDREPSLLADVRSRLGPRDDIASFEDFEALFASGTIDAAIVALPHHVHPAVVEAAGRHGIHLLKEKPLGRSLREGLSMAATMRRAGLVMHTGVQRRHHPTYVAMKEALAGRIVRSGRVELWVQGGSRSARPASPEVWRADFDKAGGGVLIDLGYHGIDLAQFLFGPLELLACSLWGEAGPTPERTVESQASVWALAGRTWLSFDFARAAEKRERIELDVDDERWIADRARFVRVHPDGREEVVATAGTSWSEASVRQLESFAEAVRTGRASVETLDDQLPVLRFLGRCYGMQALEAFDGAGEVG